MVRQKLIINDRRLNIAIAESGMTWYQFADAAHVGRKIIQGIINGNHTPSQPQVVERLCKYIGCKPETLLSDVEIVEGKRKPRPWRMTNVAVWQACRERGISYDTACKLADITRADFYTVMRGEQLPSAPFIRSLCAALHKRRCDLFHR